MKDIPTDQSASSQENIDKDVHDFQKYKAEQEAQQEKELAEDLKKFDERPKPPWYQDPGVLSMRGPEAQTISPEGGESPGEDAPDIQEAKMPGVPMESTTRYDLYEMEREGADSHQLAAWREDLPEAEKENVENSSVVGGEGVSVIDVVGKEELYYPHKKRGTGEDVLPPE
jgi:hypothetical protein